MGSLSNWDQEKALKATMFLCMRQLQGREPEEQGAQQLDFGSVKAMRTQLGHWSAPDWITQEEPVDEKPRAPKPAPSERQARSSSQPEEVPDASAAAGLFNEAIDVLTRAVEDLEHLSQVYQGRRFAGTYTFEGSWVFPRSSYSEQKWRDLCEQYGRDPDVERFSVDDVSSKHPTGASPFPPYALVLLIAAYALAGRPIESLLEVLYPKHSHADIEEINKLLYETKSQGSRDGLLRTPQQLASMVYGRKVGRGAPPELPRGEDLLACYITERREAGIADEKIRQDVLSSGRELSKEDFNRLANLRRRFPNT
jgi:hypothetical protein